MTFTVEEHDPIGFLARAGGFLLGDEARHNLMLGLAMGRAAAGVADDAYFGAVVDGAGAVVGCVMRTPPHKVLVTDLPPGSASAVVDHLSGRFDAIPAVLGPAPGAEAIARAWVVRHGGVCRPGMQQGVYRLDEVLDPEGVPGSIREARLDEVEILVEWGVGFGRDTGIPFPAGPEAILRWRDHGALRVWDDDGAAVSVAVAHGRTPRGVRVGYVYTPPERRGRGYASALVARLSRQMLDAGRHFCVLYTDLGNPTSNRIYQRIGYRLIEEVRDYDIEPASPA